MEEEMEWLSPKEAGQALGCSDSTIIARIRRGEILASHVPQGGNQIKFRISHKELEKQLAKQQRQQREKGATNGDHAAN